MALILMRFQISNLVKEYKLIKNAGHIIFCPAKFRHGEKYMGSKEKALTAAIILAGGKGRVGQQQAGRFGPLAAAAVPADLGHGCAHS